MQLVHPLTGLDNWVVLTQYVDIHLKNVMKLVHPLKGLDNWVVLTQYVDIHFKNFVIYKR